MSNGSRLSNLSESELDRSYWWVTHKQTICRVFVAFLAILAAVLIIYGTYAFIDWFFISGIREEQFLGKSASRSLDFSTFRGLGAPQTLGTNPTVVINRSGVSDLISTVTNPNSKWLGLFSYRFSGSGVNTPFKSAFVLPGDNVPVYALGVANSGGLNAAQLELSNIAWRKVDAHTVLPSYVAWAGSRLNFVITNPVYSPPGASDIVPASNVKFTATNDSAFGYKSVTFFVTLWSGTQVVGANEVPASSFKANETRQLEANFLETLNNISKIDIKPMVNILDPRAYLAPQSQPLTQ